MEKTLQVVPVIEKFLLSALIPAVIRFATAQQSWIERAKKDYNVDLLPPAPPEASPLPILSLTHALEHPTLGHEHRTCDLRTGLALPR